MSITSTLHQQQTAFAAAVLARDAKALPLAAVFVGAPEHITRRLSIYRANLQAARVSALQAAFPTVQQIVGEEFFAALAREYGLAHPSSNGNLNHFGAKLAEFIAGFAPAAELPYLSDIATLDWAMHMADSAADAHTLSAAELVQSLGQHDAEQVTLQLHASVSVIQSAHPLYDIWLYNQAVRDGKDEASLAPPDWAQAQYVLVHRQQWRASAKRITAAEAAALGALQQGQSLHAALAAALAIEPGRDLPRLLAEWCAMDILVSVNIARSTYIND